MTKKLSDFDLAMKAAGAAVATQEGPMTDPVVATTQDDAPVIPEDQRTKLSLSEKVGMIAKAIGDKKPEKHSRDVKFPFFRARDVYGWWAPHLQRAGLVLIPRVLSVDVMAVELPRSGGGTRKTFLTTLNVEFTLRDGATGEFIVGSACGQGEDPADKGAGKAMTYAEKAFLLGVGMNGAESDNEEYSDDDRDRGPRRDDRERGDVRVGPSNIEGIQRGGRASHATEAQIKMVKQIALDQKIGVRGIVEFVFLALEKVVDLPDDQSQAGPAISKFLGDLSADDIGKVIQAMKAEAQDARERPDDYADDRETRENRAVDDYDGGYA